MGDVKLLRKITISYCCCGIDVAVEMKGGAHCITDPIKLTEFILHQETLEMVTYMAKI